MPQIRDRRTNKVIDLPEDAYNDLDDKYGISTQLESGSTDSRDMPIFDAASNIEITKGLGGIPLQHAELVSKKSNKKSK